MTELSTLKPLNEVEIQINHPITSEQLDISFTVHGSDSKEYRQASRDAMFSRMSKKSDDDSFNIEDEEIDVLSKCIVSFSGIMIDGKELESNEDNVRKVITEYDWIREQISTFIMNRKNFFLTKTSKP